VKRLVWVAVVGWVLAAGPALGARPAPPLAGTDPITGKHVSLSQYKGKPVVINVWASWCGGCAVEAADLKRFAEGHPNVQMLGIDYMDSKSGAKSFYRRHDQDWPNIFDPTGRIATTLGLPAHGVPTTFFLNRRHQIVATVVGGGTLWQFERAYRKTLRSG
jgi:peroxiredoxin